MEALSLIDVSAEDDFLFDLATPPPAPAPPRHPDPTHAGSLVGAEAAPYLAPAAPGSPAAAGRAADPNGVTEEQAAPERTESPKQRKVKTAVNLRKSLAWDSAFFTGEGVLDTEELAIVNSTFRKTQGSRLPGIVEEMRKSGDSTTSTLDNETWATESLETEVFDNVRASIQRSLGKPNKVLGGLAGSSKPPKATANGPRIAARKGVDRIPQTKIRAPLSTSHGIGGVKQRPQVNSKESASERVNLPGAAEAKTSSKPPRALPRVAMMRSSSNTAITSATSDKRSSTGGAVNKQAAGKTANTSASVRPSGAIKSSSMLKSGAFTSTSSSFHGVSTATGPETKSRTALNKNRTAQRVPVRSSSKSEISKTVPSRLSGNKIASRGHTDRAASIISPSSSVDSLSSVISVASTASTVGKMSHTSESLNTLSPSLRKSNDCPPTPKLRPPIVTEGDSACEDNSKSAAGLTNKGKGFKPTGLRRPTPKIGYFDAEKSIDQNIGAQVQLQPMKIQCLLPATPKSQPPIQNMNAASSTFGQQESKLNAAPLSVEPFKVSEPEACTLQIDPAIAEPEAMQYLLPATPKLAEPLHETSASKSKAMPLIEVEPSKVADAEACRISPVVIKAEHDKSIDQKVGVHPVVPTSQASSTLCQQESKSVAASHEEISACKSKAAKAVVPLKAVQMEEDPLKVAEPEVRLHKTNPVVAPDTPKENIPAVHRNIKANVDAGSLIDLLTQKLSSISLGEATSDLSS